MATAEIAPLSKHMTPKMFTTSTSAKRIMIMLLIAATYYYSLKSRQVSFLSHKTKVQTVKMSIG